MTESNPTIPIQSTYRLQLEPSFGFEQATALVPYLAALGVSHIYSSPLFEAVSGSKHGYDVTNPAAIREALGGAEGWRRFVDALQRYGMGLIADIVPNHMALEGNAWWSDVLEHGSDSKYFSFFDLDLNSDTETGPPPRVLLIPVLGEPYGVELEAGRLQLVVEAGRPLLAYASHRFPLTSMSRGELDDSAAQSDEALRTAVAEINRDHARLHALLEQQHYRLTWWRLARDESPYRRFFDVNGLVGVRVDQEVVFDAMHRLVRQWQEDGSVQGLRVDHVDGLADPAAYLARLRRLAPEAWIVVEKILAPDEPLPDWPVDGTTGYELGALLTRLLMAGESEAAMTRLYQDSTGHLDDFDHVLVEARHEVLGHWLAGDAKRVALALYRLCQRDIRLRDYSLRDTLTLVQELAASARVYRTYVTRSGPSPADASILEGLLDGVRLRRPDVPAPLVAFAAHLFSTGGGDDADGLDFITRFQQLCTAVAAKAGEDTAFYRYNRCIALNEVGADPGVFSTDVNTFHRTIQAWQQQYPRGMRSTSTHDSKRSEDVRARLTVLSEFIEPWTALVQRWAARSDAHRIDGQPDGNFEYYLYQTMVGAWPLSRERAHVHAEKAARESKLFTDWLSPSAEYERILHHFVDALYDDSALIEELTAFVESLHPADWHKALSQLLLKLTIPGVPDVYQGSELWHLALTDPDNRATVDFNARRLLLDECATLPANAVLSRMDEGLPKLWTIERTLALKRRHRDLDGSAPYQPLEVTGSRAAHVLAFLRGSALAVVVPTRTAPGDWHDTRVVLPAGSWVHVLGEAVVDGGECPVGTLFHHFPVALLERSAP